MNNISRLSLTTIAVALILAACGGGGGGSDNSANNNNNNNGGAQTNNPGNLSVTIEPATYAAGSPEALMYAQLNDARQKGGFGTLKQSFAVDDAVQKHASYLYTNFFTNTGWNGDALLAIEPVSGNMNSHAETVGKPGFKGVIPNDRVAAAGLSNASVAEVLAIGNGPSSDGCVDDLLTTVFHRSAMLDPRQRYFGSTVKTGPDNSFVCIMNLAWTYSNMGDVPAAWVATYPGDGQIGLTNGFTGEAPNPLPGVVFKGNPVSIHINPSNSLQIASFKLTDSSGNSVAAKILTNKDFPKFLLPSEAYLVPTSTLKSMEKYTAYFSGTNNGTSFSRTWSFTTK